MLIDAGEKDCSTQIIQNIQNLGYQKIDYLIGTHPHADHIGALSDIIETFDIGTIYMPKVSHNTKTYENLLLTIKKKGYTIKKGVVGLKILEDDDLKIEILAPQDKSYEKLNNYSIVLKITYQNNSFLFMGDAESLSEKEIKGDLKSDVIKVGHHGSSTSSSDAFLKKVKPTYAIISVGKENSYHLPSNEVIKRLEKISTVYRTDINGNITISSDGNKLSVHLEKEGE